MGAEVGLVRVAKTLVSVWAVVGVLSISMRVMRLGCSFWVVWIRAAVAAWAGSGARSSGLVVMAWRVRITRWVSVVSGRLSQFCSPARV